MVKKQAVENGKYSKGLNHFSEFHRNELSDILYTFDIDFMEIFYYNDKLYPYLIYDNTTNIVYKRSEKNKSSIKFYIMLAELLNKVLPYIIPAMIIDSSCLDDDLIGLYYIEKDCSIKFFKSCSKEEFEEFLLKRRNYALKALDASKV